MQVTHNAWLVALSVAIAIEGSYVGLSLALRLRGATGAKRRALLAASAAALAVWIWGDALRRHARGAVAGGY